MSAFITYNPAIEFHKVTLDWAKQLARDLQNGNNRTEISVRCKDGVFRSMTPTEINNNVKDITDDNYVVVAF